MDRPRSYGAVCGDRVEPRPGMRYGRSVTKLSTSDLADFWDESAYFRSPEAITPERIHEAEAAVGYKLPEAYRQLLGSRNGGAPKRTCFRTKVSTSWAEDHIAISGIRGLGGKWGIDSSTFGSRAMAQEWGYPDIGIIVCECPSAGHDAVMLDYTECGPAGEPRVVHVEVETADGPDITILAPDFATFIRGLVAEDEFDTSADDLAKALVKMQSGSLSSQLAEIIAGTEDPHRTERQLRNLCLAITNKKGHFSLHADHESHLVYDTLFFLYTRHHGPTARDAYLAIYPQLLVFGDGELNTGGYAPAFVADWFAARLKAGEIYAAATGHQLAPVFATTVQEALLQYA